MESVGDPEVALEPPLVDRGDRGRSVSAHRPGDLPQDAALRGVGALGHRAQHAEGDAGRGRRSDRLQRVRDPALLPDPVPPAARPRAAAPGARPPRRARGAPLLARQGRQVGRGRRGARRPQAGRLRQGQPQDRAGRVLQHGPRLVPPSVPGSGGERGQRRRRDLPGLLRRQRARRAQGRLDLPHQGDRGRERGGPRARRQAGAGPVAADRSPDVERRRRDGSRAWSRSTPS